MASSRSRAKNEIPPNSQRYPLSQPQRTIKRERRPRIEFGPEYWMSLLESPTLSDQEKLLVILKEIECLPWKEIQIRFNLKYGTNIEKSALQMRKSRVPSKVYRAQIRQNFAGMKCNSEKEECGKFELANSNTSFQPPQPTHMTERTLQPNLCPQTWLGVDEGRNYYNQRVTTYPMGIIDSSSTTTSTSTWQPYNFNAHDQYQTELKSFNSLNLNYYSSCGPNYLPEWRAN